MALEFGKDFAREEYSFVDEMTREEDRELLQKMDCRLSDEQREMVFDSIGTNPAMLRALVTSTAGIDHKVDEFVAMLLRIAEEELAAFPHKPILKALKDHPEGVEPFYFKGQEDDGVALADPRAVLGRKHTHGVIYDIYQSKYQMMSTAHRTALKSKFA